MTTITIVPATEECKDTYVHTCNPVNPPQELPECEDGWEFGNGTVVCATQQPTATDLATTGGDPTLAITLLVVGVGMAAIGGLLVIRRARQRVREDQA
ncbi:hypothetical protein PBI_TRISCUIT_17 [Microbacterium phage Triscuit]|nr:hypothetical protein PBI_TRISCUIT_17 [Microbacterium phage Triscuit]